MFNLSRRFTEAMWVNRNVQSAPREQQVQALQWKYANEPRWYHYLQRAWRNYRHGNKVKR